MTKKILSAVVAIALALSVVAPVAASAQTTTAAYTFSTDLTVGSTGADVVALQSFLVAKGLLTIPAGVAEGYFGSLTQAAVSAYQAMKGITPTAGYFGPITRAAVNADEAAMGGVSTTSACPAGYTCTPTNPVTTPVTCPAGYTCTSTTTGAPAPSGTTEGILNITLAATPASNASIRQQNNVPVYGLQFQAQQADVYIQTVDLQFNVVNNGNGGATENPSTLINSMTLWDGSTALQTVPVTTSTFVRDQNQVYHYQFSGLNDLVQDNTTKTLTLTFNTNSIDNSRTVTIQGYGSSSIRATSGQNISSFYDVSGSAYALSQTFLQPGQSTLTLSAASNPLRSQNYRVNELGDSLQGVPLLTFNLQSQSGDSTLLTVNATTTASGTLPTTEYLYQGSTLLQSKSVGTNGSVSFNNLTNAAGSVVPEGTIQTYTIKADFAASTHNATFASTTVTSVVYQTPNGDSAVLSNSVAGVNQYVYTSAPSFTLTSTPTIQITGTNQNGSSTAMTASFAFNVTANGGTLAIPQNSDFTVVFTDGTHFATSTSVNVVTIPNNAIADGSTASVTVTAQLPYSGVPASGLYNAYIAAIHWSIAGNDGITNSISQTYGLDDYKTSAAANFIK